jgi:hypothetical protein
MAAATNGAAVADRTTQVRERLKEYLRDSPTFLALPRVEQLKLYEEMLKKGIQTASEQGLSRGLAAGDLDPTRLDDTGELAKGFLDAVDFPTFVKDLITGTYGSITASTIEQMEAYTKMFKELAKPLGAIARDIAAEDALDEVASSDSNRFSMGSEPGVVVDNDNNVEIKAQDPPDDIRQLMAEAKLKLARERRLLLREALLMGVSRLVVEKGTIKAGLLFNIKGTEAFQGKEKTTNIEQTGGQYGGSFFGLFGGGSNKRRTKITVSSRELTTNTEMTAQISGFVQVDFKSDYFKLDNFADLFGNESTKALIAQGKAGQQPVNGQPAGAVAARAGVPA